MLRVSISACSLVIVAASAAMAAPPTAVAVAEAAECASLAPEDCDALRPILAAGPDAVPAVLAALRSQNRSVRAAAAKIAARPELGDAAARTRSLLQALPETPAAVRGETLGALGRIGHATALQTLIAALGQVDDEARNRIFAANALGGYKDATARDALIAALDDTVPRVQQSAAANLGRIGDKAAVGPLIVRATAELTAGYVREAAARSLGTLGDSRALAPLVLLLATEHARVRAAAVRALGALGDKAAVPVLLAKLAEPELVPALVQALGALGDSRAAQGIASVAVQTASGVDVQRRALWILGELADPAVVNRLIPLLGSDDIQISTAAVEALGRIGSDAAAEPLRALLESPNEQLRKTVEWALEQLPSGAGEPAPPAP